MITAKAAQWATLTLMACFLISESGFIRRAFRHWFRPKIDQGEIIERLSRELSKKKERINALESEINALRRLFDTRTPMETISKGGGDGD